MRVSCLALTLQPCIPRPVCMLTEAGVMLCWPGPKGCTVRTLPTGVAYTNCTPNTVVNSSVQCDVACATGYDTPVGLSAGSCSAGTWTNAAGSCSECQGRGAASACW